MGIINIGLVLLTLLSLIFAISIELSMRKFIQKKQELNVLDILYLLLINKPRSL